MNNKKSFFYFIAVIILNFMAIFGIVYLYFNIQEQGEILRQIPRELVMAESKSQNIKFLKSQIDETKDYWEKFNSIFLTKDDLVAFIESLETNSKKLGLTLKFETVDAEKVQKPSFRFYIEGDFREVYQFLLLLENYPYRLVFKELRFVKTTDLWRADFDTILTSYLAEKK